MARVKRCGSIGNNERWKTPLGARLSRDDIVAKLKAILG